MLLAVHFSTFVRIMRCIARTKQGSSTAFMMHLSYPATTGCVVHTQVPRQAAGRAWVSRSAH